jgi:hypothetical protein
MANNITLNTGSGGAALATEDTASAHYQKVKLCYGAEGTVTLASMSNPYPVGGAAAHDAAVAGNPARIGARAQSATLAAVATGDTVDCIADLNGKLVVAPYALPETLVTGCTAAITGTSDTAVIASAGTGVRNYVTSVLVTNSHATVNTVVEIKDGSTVIWRGYAQCLGGGFACTFPVPLRGTAATAINAANITTGSNTYVSVSGYQAP